MTEQPYSQEAEEGLLGVILCDRQLWTKAEANGVSEDWFYKHPHRVVWSAIASCYQEDQDLDEVGVVHLATWLRGKDRLELAGGPELIARLSSGLNSIASGFDFYVDQLRECHVKRLLRSSLFECYEAAGDMRQPARETLEKAEVALVKLRQITDHGLASKCTETTPRKLLLEAITEIEAWSLSREKSGISTGIKAFEDMRVRLYAGQTLVLGAMPSTGKSTLALNIALNVAEEGTQVGLISLEDTGKRYIQRALANRSAVPLYKMQDGSLSGRRDLPRIQRVAAKMANIPLMLEHFGFMDLAEFRQVCRRMKLAGCEVIIIDFIQQLRSSAARDPRTRVMEVAQTCKALALDLDVSMIEVCQVARLKGRRPTMEDLKEAGEIEQLATEIVLMHRELTEMENDGKVVSATTGESVSPNPEGLRSNEVELIFAKSKDGETGTRTMTLNGPCFQLHDAA